MKKFSIFLLFSAYFLVFSPTYAMAATLSLSPTKGTFNKSCTFSLQINLNTEGAQTDGTDAIVLYDQSRVTATSITAGTIYSDYPGNNIDDSTGKVTISGLASVSSAFSGTGTLATINFTVKDTAPTGATIARFDFDENDKTKTTDSNVVERGTVADILSSVVDGNYTIGSGATCTTATPTPARGGPGSTPSATIAPGQGGTTLPEAGTPQLTYTMAIVGSVLTILGILGLALL